MTQVIADVRVDLLGLGPEELGPALPGLLGRHAALQDFLRDYAFVDDLG
jgi:hypothetical protein